MSSPAFYVYRTSSAVWVPLFLRYSAFLCLIIFFICSVSPVCPFLPLLFASGLRSENGLFFPLSHPCCFDLLFTHCVTNVTHSLGLGLRVFCPVRPVSLPFSPGSVPTLFYSTIYLHFNIFKKKSDEAPTISVSEASFSLGVGVQIRCMDFCHTWF